MTTGFSNIGSSLSALPGNIVDGINDMLVSLFIPDSGYFSDKFTEIKNKISNKFGFGVYTEMIQALSSYVSGSINFHGYIDISMWLENGRLGTIQNFIRGFFYPLILIGFVRYLTWLIRGSSSVSGGKGGKED